MIKPLAQKRNLDWVRSTHSVSSGSLNHHLAADNLPLNRAECEANLTPFDIGIPGIGHWKKVRAYARTVVEEVAHLGLYAMA